jgi:serpin B
MKVHSIPVIFIFVITLLLAGCSRDAQTDPGKEPGTGSEIPKVSAATEVDERLTGANTDFAFRLYKQLNQADGQGNIFFSPASISLALAMTYNGAAGETQRAMADTMGIHALELNALNGANAALLSILRNPDPKVIIGMANSLWAANHASLKDDFVQRNNEFYDADVTRLDFSKPEATETINAWVAEKTNDRIQKLLKPLPASTPLVLVNALYFNGSWTTSFDKEKTRDANFQLEDGSTKTVPMMYLSKKLASYAGDDFTAVRLPYGEDRLSMYVFVPEMGMEAFSAKLTPDNWDLWLNSFSEQEVDVYLPKFKAEFKLDLKETLTDMGMGVAFTADADFSGMTPGGGWWISQVVHQANIEVHEEGTEAAAATAVVMNESMPFTLRADRPFFIAIRDDLTGSILFMGAINDPQ